MSAKNNKLSTDAYKGVRDFYPEDMAIQNDIFNIWRKISQSFGYEEYNASVLEPSDIYRAKTGDEIVNEQTYSFIDRGEREVTLRPEMTPTVARMVAAKRRELVFPLRWFSIPNLFRYEQPQRGRLREHWQLNADIFGVEDTSAEIEIINLATEIVRAYGLKDNDFEIRLNNRKLMEYVTSKVFGFDPDVSKKLSKIIDRKEKMKTEEFDAQIEEIFKGRPDEVLKFKTLINSQNFEEYISHLPNDSVGIEGINEIKEVMEGLEKLGITNVRFDQTLMRGFDYYTGIVFEIFDKNPANRRSVFGGGRYDELLSLFGGEKMPAVGFGAGDVVARDIMETYGGIKKVFAPADIAICIIDKTSVPFALDVAQAIRNTGKRVVVDLSLKKLGDQIGHADKRGIADVICIGEEEVKTGKLIIKNLKSGTKKDFELDKETTLSR